MEFTNLQPQPKCLNGPRGYLGQKGYTLLKKDLTPEQQVELKRELTAKPFTQGSVVSKVQHTFPVYRESDNKFYVPRYFGESYFGPHTKNKISPGEDITVQFMGDLRDNQKPVVKTFIDHVKKNDEGGGGLLELPCAYGKCLGVDTPIIMYDGKIKLVQDVEVGDKIMGDDSTPRNVISLARGREMMYRVCSKKGDGYIVNESHILSLKCSTNHSKNMKKGQVIDMSVLEYLNLPKCFHGRGGPLLGYRVPLDFEEKSIEIDPYLFGYWLGDGSSRGTLISTQESTVIKYIVECFKNNHTSLYLKYTGDQYDYRINSMTNNNIMMDFLRGYNLLQNKHIPLHYKCNSRKIRLQLLAGIIDSDGYFCHNCYEITQKNEKLLDDIVYLARSLGFYSFKKQITKICYNSKNGQKKGTYFLTNICGKGLEEIPVSCIRKKAHPRRLIKDILNYRIKLEKIGIDDYYGFEIDGNRRFVLGDFTVTHNTVLSLNIISQLQKKSLIIVHKEFLMNQWIERIKQFLPTARVGKIQGQTIDIEDKDIVIGMLQSLSMKEYPATTFDSFGLTIIDEVHHISSEVFSCALFKLVTKYMLGLSATMNRKDGTTKIFKMFLGEVVYKGTRDEQHSVVVRAIDYVSNDEDFKTVVTDYRGQTQYSTMIVKLCEFNHRSEFILRVLGDLLKESEEKNQKQQIMILAHNKSLLKYLYDAVEARKIATVGYYVGGMKEQALKESELKQVIIATYSMAAEALDIKTLTTLIMATPKTDIEQAVGRILREKHGSPIVVDIIDEHQPFKNQWSKRKAFYKKQNYKIIHSSNLTYQPNTNLWKVEYNPNSCVGGASSKSNYTFKNDEDDENVLLKGKCLIKFKKN